MTPYLGPGASRGGRRPQSTVPQTLYGLHQDLGYFGDSSFWNPRLDAAQSIEAQLTRTTFLWSVIEPSNDSFTWTRYDNLCDNVDARGMQQIIMLSHSPSWANGSGDPWAIPTTSTPFNTWVNEYAEFCGEVANRYAGRGYLWEIWNEPNEGFFWVNRPPSSTDYAQLFTAARNAMLAEDPSAKVGLGGITGLGASGGITGNTFIQDLCNASVEFDYAGIHPYVSDLDRGPHTHVNFEQNFDDIALIRDTLVAEGYSHVELWASEWGWYAGTPDNNTKATWLEEAHERIRDEWSDFVTASAYFMDQDVVDYPSAGVFTSSLTRKPLADAFESFMATV